MSFDVLFCCFVSFGVAAGPGFLLLFVVLCSPIFMYQYIGICTQLGLGQSGFGRAVFFNPKMETILVAKMFV